MKVTCECGRELRQMRKGHLVSRIHKRLLDEQKGIEPIVNQLIKCSCGMMLKKITVTHLKSDLHLLNGGEKKSVYAIAQYGNPNFIPTLNGEKWIEKETPQTDIPFNKLVCSVCKVVNDNGDKFHLTGKVTKCKSCLYKRQKELIKLKQENGDSSSVSYRKYY